MIRKYGTSVSKNDDVVGNSDDESEDSFIKASFPARQRRSRYPDHIRANRSKNKDFLQGEGDNFSVRSGNSVSIMHKLGLHLLPSQLQHFASTNTQSNTRPMHNSSIDSDINNISRSFQAQIRRILHLRHRINTPILMIIISIVSFTAGYNVRSMSQLDFTPDIQYQPYQSNINTDYSNLRGGRTEIEDMNYEPMKQQTFDLNELPQESSDGNLDPDEMFLNPNFEKPKKKVNPTDIINQFQDESHVNKITGGAHQGDLHKIEQSTLAPLRKKETLDPNEILNQFQNGNNGKEIVSKPKQKINPAHIINQFREGFEEEPIILNTEAETNDSNGPDIATLTQTSEKNTLDPNDILNQFQFGNNGKIIQKTKKRFNPADIINQFQGGYNPVKKDEQEQPVTPAADNESIITTVENHDNAEELSALDPNDILNQFQFGNNGKTIQKTKKRFDPAEIINQFQGGGTSPSTGDTNNVVSELTLAAAVEAELKEDESSSEGQTLDPNVILNQFQFGNNGGEIQKLKKKYNPADVINQFRDDPVPVLKKNDEEEGKKEEEGQRGTLATASANQFRDDPVPVLKKNDEEEGKKEEVGKRGTLATASATNYLFQYQQN